MTEEEKQLPFIRRKLKKIRKNFASVSAKESKIRGFKFSHPSLSDLIRQARFNIDSLFTWILVSSTRMTEKGHENDRRKKNCPNMTEEEKQLPFDCGF